MWKRKKRAAESDADFVEVTNFATGDATMPAPLPAMPCEVCGAPSTSTIRRCGRHVGAVFNRDAVRGEYETREGA
jgi:hypothetical protein